MSIEEWNLYKTGERNTADIRYESRYLLVGIINRELAVKIHGEKPAEEYQNDLDILISHHNTGANCASYDYFEQYALKLQNALCAIMFNSRVEFTAKVFNNLLSAVKPNKKLKREIPVTNCSLTLDGRYDDIFAFTLKQLISAGEAGAIKACNDILSSLEREDIPLLGFSDTVAARMANGTHTPDGRLFYSLPTKIPNIDAKYLYAPGHRYPTVSLVVKPFDQG